jgi:hypothetical protein
MRSLTAGSRSFRDVKKRVKTDMERGLELLMNRSAMKGIPDAMERSRGLGEDVAKKLGALQTAMGKSPHLILEDLGKKTRGM